MGIFENGIADISEEAFVKGMNEMKKLERMLKEKDIPFKRTDEEGEYGNHRIDVFDADGNRILDAIFQYGSYGVDQGLLEVMGEPVVLPYEGDSVCGCLTAEEIMKRLDDYQNGRFTEQGFDLGIQFFGGKNEYYENQKNADILQILSHWNRHWILIPQDFNLHDTAMIWFKAYPRQKEGDADGHQN
jgi:hypothetical protein